jgi:predicted nucleic acid-binding protein
VENAHKPSVVRYFAKRGVTAAEYGAIVSDLWQRSEVIHPAGEPPPCRDEDDRKYLHCARDANADFLVTSDNDLLTVESIGGCRIVTPSELWQIIQEEAGGPTAAIQSERG